MLILKRQILKIPKIFKFSKWASIKLSKRPHMRISKVNKCANLAFEENLTKIPNIESLEVYTFFRYSNPNCIVSQSYIGGIPGIPNKSF